MPSHTKPSSVSAVSNVFPAFIIALTAGLYVFGSFLMSNIQDPGTCGKLSYNYNYRVCPEKLLQFQEDGLTILDDIISEADLLEIERIYDEYMREGSPEKQGKDFCDMSKPFNTPRSEYSVINAMLPRVYYPQLQGNAYERVAANIAKQLFPDVEMVLDYDQLLDKMPTKNDAVFAWHQDMAYWPNPSMTPDTRTVTFSLALDTTTQENGCIRYIAGTGKNKVLREHVPVGKNREESHAIAIAVGKDEVVSYAEVKRGSISMHDEYVVHGSGGNNSPGKRRTYVIAFRVKDTVRRERAANFTHSHNDVINWDVFNQWGKHDSGSDSGSKAAASTTTTAATETATEATGGEEVSEERARQLRDHQAALERYQAMQREEQERAARMEENKHQEAIRAEEERERRMREHQIAQEREEHRRLELQRQQEKEQEEKRRRQQQQQGDAEVEL